MSENTTTKTRSGSETRQRRHSRPIRLDDAELAICEEAASRLGVTFSSFARAAMLTTAQGKAVGFPARSVRRPPVERELLAQTLGQLGKVGSNLNQIAHQGHAHHQIDMTAVEHAIGELRDMLPVLMDALGRKVA